ncbi:MAG TPA: ATP-binding protein, partial [Solirubrobacteraceae bacterium]|nr:ATP-binding protein [Solirubrobacteraceae bacterium]
MDLRERDAELHVLSELVRSARQGDGGLAVIEGPPGIGKSSLLRALAAECDAAGAGSLVARATRLVGEVPFGLAR